MFSFKKSQAALEFLSTYGWAFLVTLIMVGGLSGIGVLDGSRFTSESCLVGSPFFCERFVVGDDGFLLSVRNSLSESLVVTGFSYETDDGFSGCDDFSEVTISGSSSIALECAFSGDETLTGSFRISYRSVTDTSSSFVRNSAGSIRGESVKSSGSSGVSVLGSGVTGPESCPDGFVFVSGSSYFETSSFCVMRWEAKAYDTNEEEVVADGCDGGCNANWADSSIVPVSVAEGVPWRRITANSGNYDAIDACESQGWRLINNREWMTIARHIEANPDNWEDGVVGSTVGDGGGLNRGAHRNNNQPAFNGSEDCLYFRYNSCGDSGDFVDRRTFYLSSGEVVWDFAGNLWNWVDFMEDGSSIPSGNACSGDSQVWRGFNGDSINDCVFSNGFSQNSSVDKRFEVGPLGGFNAVDHRVGRIYPRDTTNRFALRGGGWSYSGGAGVFALYLHLAPSSAHTHIGFRCVVNPGN